MASLVYETVLEYGSSGQLLLEIRQTVKELRQSHPQLKQCVLADLAVQRCQTAVNVTLSFQPAE